MDVRARMNQQAIGIFQNAVTPDTNHQKGSNSLFETLHYDTKIGSCQIAAKTGSVSFYRYNPVCSSFSFHFQWSIYVPDLQHVYVVLSVSDMQCVQYR